MSWTQAGPGPGIDPFAPLPAPVTPFLPDALRAPPSVDLLPPSFGVPASLDYAAPYVDDAAPPAVAPELLAAQLAEADAALRDRFQIVEPVDGQEVAPNQITQEAYDRVVAQYADVANGRGDLRLATDMKDPDAFRAGALDDLATMLQSTAGRSLIAELHDNAGPDDERRTTTLGLAASVGDSMCDLDQTQKDRIYSGGPGIDAAPRYVPGASTVDDDRSDVLLFHELRHALDVTRGMVEPGYIDKDCGVPTDYNQGGVLNADHQVIGIGRYDGVTDLTENDYRQDRVAIGAGGVGVVPGDLEMELRETYK